MRDIYLTLRDFDPKQNDGTVETIIPAVMSWLATRPDAVRVPPPNEVLDVLQVFQEKKSSPRKSVER